MRYWRYLTRKYLLEGFATFSFDLERRDRGLQHQDLRYLWRRVCIIQHSILEVHELFALIQDLGPRRFPLLLQPLLGRLRECRLELFIVA